MTICQSYKIGYKILRASASLYLEIELWCLYNLKALCVIVQWSLASYSSCMSLPIRSRYWCPTIYFKNNREAFCLLQMEGRAFDAPLNGTFLFLKIRLKLTVIENAVTSIIALPECSQMRSLRGVHLRGAVEGEREVCRKILAETSFCRSS